MEQLKQCYAVETMWIIYAVCASIFWGITYVINEYVYKHISILSSIAITTLCTGFVIAITAFLSGALEKDIATISSSTKVLAAVSLGVFTLIVAELFIGLSISNKNAVVAGIIEISYPIFIVLFSFLLFRETHLTLWSYVGFALVLAGIVLVYLFNH